MNGPRSAWLVAALGVALLSAAVGAQALEGLGGPLAAGGSHYVQVVESDGAGVLAGLATETTSGPFGIGEQTHAVQGGWVVAHPAHVDVESGQSVDVLEEVPFEDPNGGMWGERKVDLDGATAWAVPVDTVRHDATLEADYNFALVVDWDEVPEDADLETSYVDSLDLAEDA